MVLFVILFFTFVFGFFDLMLLFFFLFFFILNFLFFSYGGFFSGFLYLDYVSFLFSFLCVFLSVGCLCGVFVDKWSMNFYKGYLLFFSLVFLFSVLSFFCLNFLVFYFSFEFIFLLMFLFLLGWGYSPERLQSSFYMVFYTLVVSFPFLVFLLFFYDSSFSGVFIIKNYSFFWPPFIFLVFMVKLPMYLVHLWLPKAHVEAPVGGSMALAGILLKLGGYGLYRFSFCFYKCLTYYSGYLVAWGILGGLLSCLLCLRQVDLKSFVAYSSVCHMGFGISGMYSGNTLGMLGFIIMMLAHGFVSSCLFYMLYVVYKRVGTRSLILAKGFGSFSFVFIFFLFLFCALNMGVPPSFSFFSEVSLTSGLVLNNFFNAPVCFFILFWAGVYNIYLFVGVGHGESMLSNFFLCLSIREVLVVFFHFSFMVTFVLFMYLLF